MNSLATATSSSTSAASIAIPNDSKSELQASRFDGSTGSKNSPYTQHLSHSANNVTHDHPRDTPPIGGPSVVRSIVSNPVASIRMVSAEFGSPRSQPHAAFVDDSILSSDGTSPLAWSSAVGKANLGKSGRVIERLMGENDMLKRDLQIEKLKAEESRNAKKMAEGKMEAHASEYEGRLHDAAINKTILKRRERQVTELKAQLEVERSKANSAVESERAWRSAMEKSAIETKEKIDEATNYSMLLEGRYKSLSSHWKEQGAMVDVAISRMKDEISTMIQERQNDARRMDLLHQLCDQQADRLVNLEEEKASIAQSYESYKAEQEHLLYEIKAKAQEQEQANERTLAETKLVLGQLKWALAVKCNVRDYD